MIELNPNEIHERYRMAGERWARAEAEASRLEHKRKVLRSQIMIACGKMAINKAQMLAEGDPAYSEHIDKQVAARCEANIAWAEFEAIKVWIDTARSREATERAQMVLR